jgi:hypothetical protein
VFIKAVPLVQLRKKAEDDSRLSRLDSQRHRYDGSVRW